MKEANPKLVGVFVIGGISLAVAALVLFSAQDFFEPKRKFVAYFQQSVNGLNVGAAVSFRGIPIGKVTDIRGIYDPETGYMMPRVMLEIHPEKMKNAVVEEGEYTLFPLLVQKGMRASLKSSSFLTGQLYISLDFYPDVPVRQLGSADEEYPEMPTIDSGLDKALEKLSELPIREVLAGVTRTLTAVEVLLTNPNFEAALSALPLLMADADTVLVDLHRFVNRDLTNLARGASEALASVSGSVKTLSTAITDETLPQFNSVLVELEKSLQLAQQRLAQDDPLWYELFSTLREVGSAARSMRELADYLEEHPESLLKGKASK